MEAFEQPLGRATMVLRGVLPKRRCYRMVPSLSFFCSRPLWLFISSFLFQGSWASFELLVLPSQPPMSHPSTIHLSLYTSFWEEQMWNRPSLSLQRRAHIGTRSLWALLEYIQFALGYLWYRISDPIWLGDSHRDMNICQQEARAFVLWEHSHVAPSCSVWKDLCRVICCEGWELSTLKMWGKRAHSQSLLWDCC